MIYCRFGKVHKSLIEDNNALSKFLNPFFSDIRKAPENNFRKLLNFTTEFFEDDGDNFIRGLVTIRVTCESFKAPRIVSRNKISKHRKRFIRYITLN